MTEWAERNVVLDDGLSTIPGEYRVRRTPYLAEIMDGLSVDSPVPETVLMKGSQVGGSQAATNWVGYLMDLGRGSIVFVEPTTDLATRFSEVNLGPMIASAKALKGKVREPRSRDSGNKILRKKFPGGYLFIVGANSGAGLRQTSGPWLVIDEIDALPRSIPGEGNPVQLAERASKTFPRRKRLYISTPTIQGRSPIETLYENSDQRRYFVPCPHCGVFQVLVFKDAETGRYGLRFEGTATALGDVYYECEGCAGRIEEWHKAAMFERGEWRAKFPERSALRHGYHLSSLYAAPGTYTWRDFALEFLKSKDDPEKLRVFVNQWCGETYREKGDAPPWKDLYRRRETYKASIVPNGAVVLTAGADVQRDRIEVAVWAWGPDLESWAVDHIVLPGSTVKEKVWSDLERVLWSTWKHESGAHLKIRGLALDTAYESTTAYAWSRKHAPDHVFCVRGTNDEHVLVAQPAYIDYTYRGRRIQRGVRLWRIGTGIAKRELYEWLKIEAPLDPGTPMPRFVHFPQFDEEWFKQLTAEELAPFRRGGLLSYRWEKIHERNEVLDCRVYARGAAYILLLDRWTEADWKRERDSMTPEGTPSLVAPKKKSERPRREGYFQSWRGPKRT